MTDALFIPFRILVIEHNDPFRFDITKDLEAKGFTARGEKHSHNSEKVAEDFDPELCLISLEMPRMDGIFIIRKFRRDERFKKIPVIAMAENVDKRQVTELRDLKVKDVLMKPVERKKLIATVEKHYKVKVIAEIYRE